MLIAIILLCFANTLFRSVFSSGKPCFPFFLLIPANTENLNFRHFGVWQSLWKIIGKPIPSGVDQIRAWLKHARSFCRGVSGSVMSVHAQRGEFSRLYI